MHDDLLERRLRSALHGEAARLSFTITAAELERRALLQGRVPGGRRLMLLLAAAVGVGAVGVGTLMAGLLQAPVDPSPAPTQAVVSTPTAEASPPAVLPGLDEMIAAGDPGSVVFAQAQTPFDPSVGEPSPSTLGDPFVTLGPVPPGEYQIDFVCSGGRAAVVLPGPGIPESAPAGPCDGTIRETTVGLAASRSVRLLLDDTEAWRVVVRRVGGDGPAPAELPATLPDAGGREVLNRVDALTIPDGPAWPGTDLPFTELEGLAARPAYEIDVSCARGEALRFILGDEVDGQLVAVTTTQLPCDGTLHQASLGLAQPFGTRMYVAGEAGAIVSLMVSAQPPPIALVRQLPGWQLSAGTGPDLAFDTGSEVFTGPGVEGGGPVLIAVSCAGTGTVEVLVTLQHATEGPVTNTSHAQFDAPCGPDGVTTSSSFAEADAHVDVEYTTPAGAWIAVGILVPDPLPAPR